ncbi:response regulator [Zavarzinella formosa]|uniref:response regulator n=1 Tax=Zavarzinella formosa TaxID=360055 RepID=UPI00037FE799|nr:response regulator [Zavarzinella formosa]
MKRVLFVDDEPLVLGAIQRLLWPIRRELTPKFAGSGEEALKLLSSEPFDVIVSDMRMPGMDGAELLSAVRSRWPEIIRITLTGEAGAGILTRVLPVAHRFLSKPCDPELLRSTITRACELRQLLESGELRNLAAGLRGLPSLPKLYREIVAELESPDPSMQNVAGIVSQDMGMTVKLIQVANSPVFGRRFPAANIGQAVIALGMEMTRNLVLAGGLFSGFPPEAEETFQLGRLWEHCRLTAELARIVAESWNADARIKQDAATAGFLHEVGQLVFAASIPDRYARVFRATRRSSAMLLIEETKEFGTTHAAIGAYLLGLWGIPETVIEAVAWHHTPNRPNAAEPTAIAAVRIADELIDSFDEERAPNLSEFSTLASAGQQAEWLGMIPTLKGK